MSKQGRRVEYPNFRSGQLRGVDMIDLKHDGMHRQESRVRAPTPTDYDFDWEYTGVEQRCEECGHVFVDADEAPDFCPECGVAVTREKG